MMDRFPPHDILTVLKSTLRKIECDSRPATAESTQLKRVLTERIGKLEAERKSLLLRES